MSLYSKFPKYCLSLTIFIEYSVPFSFHLTARIQWVPSFVAIMGFGTGRSLGIVVAGGASESGFCDDRFSLVFVVSWSFSVVCLAWLGFCALSFSAFVVVNWTEGAIPLHSSGGKSKPDVKAPSSGWQLPMPCVDGVTTRAGGLLVWPRRLRTGIHRLFPSVVVLVSWCWDLVCFQVQV